MSTLFKLIMRGAFYLRTMHISVKEDERILFHF